MGTETFIAEDGTIDAEAALKFLRRGSKIPGDCGNSPKEKPQWLDIEKCQRARKFVSEYYYSVMTCHSAGLYLMAQVPSLAKPLVFTGKSESIAKSCQRWADTIHHIYAWYDGDVWEPTDYAHKSVMVIRGRHQRVNERMNTKDQTIDYKIPTPEKEGDVWLSQYDMSITLFTFLGAMIVSPEKLALSADMEEDLDALIHFWRCIGYLLGIEDDYNLFGFGGFRSIRPLCRLIIQDVSIFHWNRPTEEFSKMLSIASDALRYFTFMSSEGAMINFAFYVADEPERIPMDWYAYFCRYARSIVLYLMRFPTARRTINSLMKAETMAKTKKYMTGGSGQCPVQKYHQDTFLSGLYQRAKKLLY